MATTNMQPTISQQHQTTFKIITQNPKHAHKTSQVPFHARQNLPTSPYAQQSIRLSHCKQLSQAPQYVKNSKASLQNAHYQYNGGSMVPNHAAFGSYAQNQTNLQNSHIAQTRKI